MRGREREGGKEGEVNNSRDREEKGEGREEREGREGERGVLEKHRLLSIPKSQTTTYCCGVMCHSGSVIKTSILHYDSTQEML